MALIGLSSCVKTPIWLLNQLPDLASRPVRYLARSSRHAGIASGKRRVIHFTLVQVSIAGCCMHFVVT